MTINELIEKRNKVWQQAKDFLDSRRTENGTLTAEDDATYSKMEKDVVDLGNEIDRLERQKNIDEKLRQPTRDPLLNNPSNGGNDDIKTGRASNEYKDAMETALRSNFRKVSDILQEGVDGDGGYLVPDEMDARLISTISEENIMRNLATIITTSGSHKMNIDAGGVAAKWVEEGGALTFSDGKFAQKILDAHKLVVAVKVTEELAYDSAFNISSYITDKFGKALGDAEEEAFLIGTGGTKPTGIFDTTNGGESAGTLSAAIKSDDILDLIYALKRGYRKNASFILNDKTVAQIRKLKDNNGAYIWQPSYKEGEPDMIAGFKYYTSAFAPEDKIAFGDYSYYNIGDRGTRSFAELRELFAGNGMIGYKATERVDGVLVLPEAVQILTLKASM